MLRQRVLTVLVLLPFALALIYLGGWAFTGLVILLIGLAAWEFWRMFRQGGYAPSAPVLIGGAVLLVLLRARFAFQYSDLALSLLVLTAMTWHTLDYERGRDTAATDFAITLGGILYLGWLGGYFVSLRALDQGMFWFLLALPAVWLADTGAYSIGRRIGRHKISRRVSPNKSWEGYVGGILFGVAGSAGLAAVWHAYAPAITAGRGAVLGLVIAIVTTLGDLGESMIKRQFGVKDSSHLIPGHGGVMDRIDSWLWAVAISYYLITLFW